ncbi:MAG: response regulator [Myxococcales bacterium]|nr:response regulator [Myxococcales bacterium]
MTKDAIRVMVVDDDPDQLDMVARVLKRRGFVVETANSPFGVTNKARAFDPHLILVDVNIPALSGDQLIGLIRKNASLDHTRMILFSAMDEVELRKLAKQVGADGSIQKNFNGDYLSRKIKAVLR